MIITLQREESFSGSKYAVISIVNPTLGNIVEKIRNNVNNDKSWVTYSYRTLVPKHELENTLNRIVNITSLTRRPISISTINEKGNIFIDTSVTTSYIVTKGSLVFPGPNTITFTIKLVN